MQSQRRGVVTSNPNSGRLASQVEANKSAARAPAEREQERLVVSACSLSSYCIVFVADGMPSVGLIPNPRMSLISYTFVELPTQYVSCHTIPFLHVGRACVRLFVSGKCLSALVNLAPTSLQRERRGGHRARVGTFPQSL